MSNRKDYTGQKFGKLTAIKYVGKTSYGTSKWLFNCDCGNTYEAAIADVVSGKQVGCGCGRIEHGLTKDNQKLMQVWIDAKERCYNVNRDSYKTYGAVGIKMCDRWLNSFQNFYDDVKDLYRSGLQIDRINTFGDYEPNNVRWVSRTQQMRNTKRNIYVIVNDRYTYTLTELCNVIKVNYKNARNWLKAGKLAEKLNLNIKQVAYSA